MVTVKRAISSAREEQPKVAQWYITATTSETVAIRLPSQSPALTISFSSPSVSRNRPTELEHEGTAAAKARGDKVGVKMNAMLARTGGLTTGDVIDQLFAGIATSDFYIKACTEAPGGQPAINGAIRQCMEDQTSGRLPTPIQGFSQPPRPAKL